MAKRKPDISTSPSDGTVPTEDRVRDELLFYWDGYSPLSLSALTIAYANGNTLDEVGIAPDEAQACVNKYNSIIARAPGKGPIVSPSLARAWASEKMANIVKAVTKRAHP